MTELLSFISEYRIKVLRFTNNSLNWGERQKNLSLGNMKEPFFSYADIESITKIKQYPWMFRIPLVILSAMIGGLGISDQAKSENLLQALSSAYVNNPILSGERARQRATDEYMPIARSNFRPSLSLSGDVESTRTKTRNDSTTVPSTTTTTTEPWGYTVSVNQPIFRGFRSLNEVRSAEAQIYAGREELRSVEQTTLLNAVSAFVDVGQDLAIVGLLQHNVRVLSEQLEATRERFSVGEVTSTDVAQAEVRLNGAQSRLSLAQASLKTSRAVFEEVIGHVPRKLQMPSLRFRFIPRSLAEALAVADSENPRVVNTIYRELQARHDVDLIRGELLPTIDLEASFSETFDTSDTVKSEEVGTVIGRLTFPFYQGGVVHARIRQAKQFFDSAQKMFVRHVWRSRERPCQPGEFSNQQKSHLLPVVPKSLQARRHLKVCGERKKSG